MRLIIFQYAAILMGISNTIGTIPGIVSPIVTGYIVQNRVKYFDLLGIFSQKMFIWASIFISYTTYCLCSKKILPYLYNNKPKTSKVSSS